jgi:hypothetical protein
MEPLDADPGESGGASPAQTPDSEQTELLKGMLNELRKLSRAQRFDEFSIWNLFGGLAQVLVFLAMFLWFIGDAKPLESPHLMLALILQVMALTFFSIGK